MKHKKIIIKIIEIMLSSNDNLMKIKRSKNNKLTTRLTMSSNNNNNNKGFEDQ